MYLKLVDLELNKRAIGQLSQSTCTLNENQSASDELTESDSDLSGSDLSGSDLSDSTCDENSYFEDPVPCVSLPTQPAKRRFRFLSSSDDSEAETLPEASFIPKRTRQISSSSSEESVVVRGLLRGFTTIKFFLNIVYVKILV